MKERRPKNRFFLRSVRAGVGEAVGRRGRQVLSLLDDQLDATCRGARLAIEMVQAKVSRQSARSLIARIEHEGDASRKNLITVLRGTFIMAIDREDLYRLSRAVDDILDGVRDFIRESDLYRIEDQHRLIPLLTIVLDGVLALQKAVATLGIDFQKTTRYSLLCRRKANNLRNAFQYELAQLFEGELGMETLRYRELLRRLETISMKMYEAADSLNDGMWKRLSS